MPRKKKETLKRRKDGRYRCVWQGMAFYSSESAEDALRKRDEYRRMMISESGEEISNGILLSLTTALAKILIAVEAFIPNS